MKFNKTLIASAMLAAGLGLATSTYAIDKGDWLMRLGATSVNPDDSSTSNVFADDVIGVDSGTSLSISFTYMYSDNVGVEILASLPFSHDITASGSSIGEVEHLPPTVSLEYHFNPKSDVRPYVSAGLNWTTILDESIDIPGASMSVDDSTGLALTAGVDVDINKDWFFNASVRYMDIDTTAEITGGVKVDLEIDPWVYTLGVGSTF